MADKTAEFYVKPQLARGTDFAKIDKVMMGRRIDYSVEPKYDGMRAIIEVSEHGRVQITSRSGKDITAKVPDIVAEVKDRVPLGTILDGELAAISHEIMVDGTKVPIADFNATMRVMGSSPAVAIAKQADTRIRFIAFDCIKFDGNWIGAQANLIRRRRLHSILKQYQGIGHPFSLVYTPYWDNVSATQVEYVHDRIVAQNGEGVILKDLVSTYEAGGRPNNTWYKLKVVKTFDVVVLGFTDANEGKTGKFLGQIGAIKFGAYNAHGALVPVGQCSGMNDEERAVWTAVRDYNAEHGIHTPDMKTVIEVRSNDLVGSGEYKTPRHPQYVRARQDKDASECTMEQFRNETYSPVYMPF